MTADDFQQRHIRDLKFALETIAKLARDVGGSAHPHHDERRAETLKFIAAIADEASGANIPF